MVGRLRGKLAEEGVAGTARAVGRRLRQELASERILIVLLKDLEEIVAPRRQGELLVEPLTREHLPLLSALNRERGAADADERFRRYLDAGYHGFVALLGGEAVGYYWWVDQDGADFPDLGDLGLGVELGPGDVYGSDYYMLERFRDGARANEVLFRVETALRARGYERLWGYVLADNRPARWLYSTRGYESAWRVVRRKRLGLERVRRELLPAA